MSDKNSIKSLFREKAVNNQQVIDPQSVLTIVKPAVWFYLACLFCFLIALLWWGGWGKIEITIPAIGIIVSDDEFKQAENLLKNNINEHQEKLTILSDLFSKQKKLFEQHIITINELEKTRQDYLTAKDELATLSRQNVIALVKPIFNSSSRKDNSTLDALVFVNHEAGKKIKQGMNVYVLPNTISAYQYGYLKGQVSNISEYPITKETVYSFLGNMSLVDEFFQGSAPFMVKVKLMLDPHTSSGLAWTSKQGANFKIEAGTTVTARIVHRIAAPISLISTAI